MTFLVTGTVMVGDEERPFSFEVPDLTVLEETADAYFTEFWRGTCTA